MGHVREELVLRPVGAVQLSVEARQLAVLLLEGGILGFEALSAEPHLGREPARLLVRRLALAREGEVGGRGLEQGVRVGSELRVEQRQHETHEPFARAQWQQCKAVGGPPVQLEARADRVGRRARELEDARGIAHDLPHGGARQRSGPRSA